MTKDMPQGKKTVSDTQIVQAIDEHADPVLSAQEVAEIFGHTRQWADSRLKDLAEEGRVQKKSGGPRSVMWWVPH